MTAAVDVVVDTSVAIPLLVAGHEHHARVGRARSTYEEIGVVVEQLAPA